MKQFSKELGKVSITPKGNWDSNITNERLDIVYDRRNNQAYIAKQDVPIGVDIDNREYWQPLNATGYADNNFINLTAENENGTITAYDSLEEAVATIFPINRRVGATLSFYNLNSDRLDRQAEFELWQFNSTDLANWENKDYWNNIYYNWNVFAGWYIDADALNNHVKIPNVGQYAYVGSNLNDAILYQCRTNGTWTNTGIKVRNYISVVVSGNITIGDNGNWFSDGKDTGIPATPAVDEQLDNIIMQLQQHNTEINNLKESNANLQDQITSNDSDITNLTAKHESLSRTVQGIAATGGASTATNVTYNNDASGLNAENAQDAIDEVSNKLIYDVSARNNGTVFESLQALLSSSNLSTLIPTSVRYGGMSIRFIQGSVPNANNKYVQFRLMKNTWSTIVSDWQGVDEKPIKGSNNLVKSGGVVDALKKVSEIEKEIIVLDSEEKVSFTNNEETETYVEISSEGIKAKKYYFLNGAELKLENPYYILDASGNGDFTTVAQAISNVPKLGVVLVKPGEYSVKSCFFANGQRFIGFTDSTECVFYVDDGLYNSAPLIKNGYFENLSFESRHKESNTSRKGYCVHIDDIKIVQGVPFEVKFINCIFKSWNSDCIGCGGAKDFKLYLENCRLYQYGNDGGTDDALPNYSCFAMHGAANMKSTSQYAGPVYVYIKDSILITYTKSALRFGYDRYTGEDGIIIPGGGEWELINNTLYSYKDNNGVPYGTNCVTHGSGEDREPISSFPIAGTDWALSPLNHGNNSQVININK